MSDQPPSGTPLREHKLRSGTAARLAGLPATTLRVWERRYAVVDAPKSINGQRLYGDHDVQRLTLMKALTGLGHPIGTIARLELPALTALAAGASKTQAPQVLRPRVVAIGRGVAQKLKSAANCEVVRVHDDLTAAELPAAAVGTVDLLVAHLPSLQPLDVSRLLGVNTRLSSAAMIVVYGFGADEVAESLRANGAVVRRDPVSGRDLARLVAAPSAVVREAATVVAPPLPTSPAARVYSDVALVDIAESPSSIACECMRHVAEIVMQLAGFERYSADCVSSSPADAALHRQLSGTAGVARTMFEAALQTMVAESKRATAD